MIGTVKEHGVFVQHRGKAEQVQCVEYGRK
jgi:hypothetical protein